MYCIHAFPLRGKVVLSVGEEKHSVGEEKHSVGEVKLSLGLT